MELKLALNTRKRSVLSVEIIFGDSDKPKGTMN